MDDGSGWWWHGATAGREGPERQRAEWSTGVAGGAAIAWGKGSGEAATAHVLIGVVHGGVAV